MPGDIDHLIGSRPYGLRLDTLVRLRWLAVAGQTLTLVVVYWGLDIAFPIWLALALVALTAATNLALRLLYPRPYRLSDPAAGFLLAYDIVQLGALLSLTGGLGNPFSLLFLAPVLISATALSSRTMLLLGMLVVVMGAGISFFYIPLQWYLEEEAKNTMLHRISDWVALVISVAFIGAYAWKIADETRQLSDALAETELVLAREQHLSALDGLAAAAAHELGTPLATIAVVVRELERSMPADSPHMDDFRLLREQSERCRSILRTLTSLGSGDAPFDRMPLSHLLEEVVTPHRPVGIPITVELPLEHAGEPIIARNPAILYGLGNLVENAVDFAQGGVSVSAHWNAEDIAIIVTDDGPGFAPEVINRIGEPYVTIRGRRRVRAADEPGGLGLGFFIAKTLLERTGAALSLENRSFPHTGAVVRVCWPRAVLGLNLNSEDRPWSAVRPEQQSATTLATDRAKN
jgi:two-component system sensor histidine kinase RegB